jgi:hypothetical protein
MPLEGVREKAGPFTDKHLADIKLLETKLASELVVCTKAWIEVSLRGSALPQEKSSVLQEEELGFACSGMKDTGKDSERASKLFERMKDLREQMHEVERLVSAAQCTDVVW